MDIENQEFNVLLAKHFLGELTDAEEAVVQAWIKDNIDEYISLRYFYSQSNEPLQSYDTHTAWQRVAVKTGIGKPSVFKRNKIAALLAVLLLVVSIVVLLYANTKITVSSGAFVRQVVLTDGTIVTLYKNSSITYNRAFLWCHSLALKGEASFDVQPQDSRPFCVRLDNVQISTLGASFEVHDKENRIFVHSGEAKVKLLQPKQILVLKKKQSAIVSDKKLSRSDH